MKGARSSVRYAKALLDLSTEQNAQDQVYSDMKMIAGTIRESRDLSNLLRSPIIKTDKKQNILKLLFEGKVSKITGTFMNLLAAKRREANLETIALEFTEQYKVRKNILTAVITSATAIDDTLRKKVLDLVRKSSNSEVELVEKINEKLIGGFTLQVGDRRIDASLANQVRKLAMNFSENPYIKEY